MKKIKYALIPLLAITFASCSSPRGESSSPSTSSEPTTSVEPSPSSSSEEAIPLDVALASARDVLGNSSINASYIGKAVIGDGNDTRYDFEIDRQAVKISIDNTKEKYYEILDAREFEFGYENDEKVYQGYYNFSGDFHYGDEVMCLSYLADRWIGIDMLDLFRSESLDANVKGRTLNIEGEFSSVPGKDSSFLGSNIKDISFLFDDDNNVKEISFKSYNMMFPSIDYDSRIVINSYDGNLEQYLTYDYDTDGVYFVSEDRSELYAATFFSDNYVVNIPEVNVIHTGAIKEFEANDVIIPASVQLIEEDAIKINIVRRVYYNGDFETLFSMKVEGENPFSEAERFYIYDEDGEIHYDNKPYTVFPSEITIPSSISEINQTIITGSNYLHTIHIPYGVYSINEKAFKGSTNLETVDLEEGSYLTEIGKEAFDTCTALSSFNFENASYLENINERAFRYTSLNDVKLPSSLINIKEEAFQGCSYLKEIYIPSNVELIGVDAFDITGLRDIYVQINSIEEWLNKDYNFNFKRTPFGNIHLMDALNNDEEIFDVVIPNSITELKEKAFYSCSSLRSVRFEEGTSVSNIKEGTFSNCTNLVSFAIPQSIEEIDDYAFNNDFRIVEVLNNSVIEDDDLIYYFSALKNVIHSQDQTKLVLDLNGYVFYQDGIDLILVNYIGDDEDIVIPNTATKLMMYALSERSDIKSISFEDDTQINEISYGCMENCYELETVNIPASTTRISSSAFRECPNLKNVNFAPNSQLETIFDYAFYEDTALVSINLPSSLKSIEEGAFQRCYRLRDINFENDALLNKIGSGAFRYCYSLYQFELPSNVNNIGNSAFGSCEKLVEIINKSSLVLEKGSYEYGGIAAYAKNIITDAEDSNLIKYNGHTILYKTLEETVVVAVVVNVDRIDYDYTMTPTSILSYAFSYTTLKELSFDMYKEDFLKVVKGATNWRGDVETVYLIDSRL